MGAIVTEANKNSLAVSPRERADAWIFLACECVQAVLTRASRRTSASTTGRPPRLRRTSFGTGVESTDDMPGTGAATEGSGWGSKGAKPLWQDVEVYLNLSCSPPALNRCSMPRIWAP